MSDRIFTNKEVKQAETLLLMLANESVQFWAQAFLSPSFLYQGEVWYYSSSFYKSSCWMDKPNDNHDPITGEQIIRFMNVYMDEAKKKIERLINSDVEVAKILGLKQRLNIDWTWKDDDEYLFGGWDNDPWGEVAIAKKEAGLDGPMSVNSGYRKTTVRLCKGKIYKNRRPIKEIDIQ